MTGWTDEAREASIAARHNANGKAPGEETHHAAMKGAMMRNKAEAAWQKSFVQGRGKETDVFAQHQTKIAIQTLKYSDVGARIMGGMTKDQARAHLGPARSAKIEGLYATPRTSAPATRVRWGLQKAYDKKQ